MNQVSCSQSEPRILLDQGRTVLFIPAGEFTNFVYVRVVFCLVVLERARIKNVLLRLWCECARPTDQISYINNLLRL